MTTETKRGGARPGAGRPPAEHPRDRYQVRLKPETVAKLREIGGGSLSDGIETLTATTPRKSAPA